MINYTFIREYSKQGTLLSKLHGNLKKDFAARLLLTAKNMGISKLPDPQRELPDIIEYLRRQFGYLTDREILHAMELRAAGDIVTKDHYGRLSWEFLSNILNGYFNIKQNMPPNRIETSHQLGSDSRTEKQKCYDSFKSLIEWILKDGKIPMIYDWELCYRHLEFEGRISLTIQEKEDFIQSVKKEYARSVSQNENLLNENAFGDLKDDKSLPGRCRIKYFKEWLNDQCKRNTIKTFCELELKNLKKYPE